MPSKGLAIQGREEGGGYGLRRKPRSSGKFTVACLGLIFLFGTSAGGGGGAERQTEVG